MVIPIKKLIMKPSVVYPAAIVLNATVVLGHVRKEPLLNWVKVKNTNSITLYAPDVLFVMNSAHVTP